MKSQTVPTEPFLSGAPVTDPDQSSLPESQRDAEQAREKMHELFEQQVERTPDAIAVSDNHRQFTYAVLNRRSNQLARYLKKLGIGPEARVGVCMERSAELIVALLGILKAGAAYVPLDPAYPAERLRFMLEDAEVAVLLTQRSVSERVELSFAGRLIQWEEELQQISLENEENLASGVNQENLAYLIYTSGSTGRPKAVGIRHASVTVLLLWAQQIFSVEETAGVLGATSICFDLSVFEIFVPLSRGGRVMVVANALELLSMPRPDEVTLVNTVPSAMAELLRMNQVPASVRVVNLAGEALPKALVKQVYERTRVERLFNLYGPSEDTTYSTCAYLSREQMDAEVSIGRPIPGTQAYVLDENVALVAAGTIGELFLGGSSLARGYVNRPELTAEKFLSDPFTATPGQRMYRTGDLVRSREDGQLEFLGRADSQVKLRGYRIELGEIENELQAHEQVDRAVVVVREDHPGDKKLVAYVVRKDMERVLSSGQLREHLRQRLPEYMVPGAWVELERFPLSPNGKIDRKSLPRPENTRPSEEARSYVAPRTPVEQHLAKIWAELLNLEQLGIHDNFFELGGHSLIATRVLSRVAREYGVTLHMQSLFDAPTLEEFSRTVQVMSQDSTTSEKRMRAPLLQKTQRDQPIPLSFPQQMLWIVDQLHPSMLCYNVAEGFRLQGDLNIDALRWALAEIVRRHEALRTRFVLQGDTPVQEIETTVEVPLPVIDLTGLEEAVREQRAQQLLVQKAREPFYLKKGQLFRALLVRLGAQEYKLMLTVHHIVTDGWSQRLLWSELSALYCSYGQEKISLPALPIQYSDYAVWQRDWLDEENLRRFIGYWKLQLANIPPEIKLPSDRLRPPVQTFRGARANLGLDAALVKPLRKISRARGCTLFMLLLAAFKTLLYRHSGEEDIAVATAIADRRNVETEGLIGFFINTLVLRTNLSGNPSFSELLRRVSSVVLEAHRHQDAPFQKLVEYLGVNRNLTGNSLAQVMFAFENTPSGTLNIPGVQTTPLPIDIRTSMCDLLFSLTEAEGHLTGFVEYSTDLFDTTTVQRLISHYMTLLQAVVMDPEKDINSLVLAPAEEQVKLLQEWNRTEAEFQREICLHRMFEQQAARTPDEVAVADKQQQLTYCELNRRANQLAHYLIGAGVKAEGRVGVCMPPSTEMITAVLAVLKAGATYVPIDPAYPAVRLALIVEDAAVGVLLTQSNIAASLPNKGSHRTVLLDRDSAAIAGCTEGAPQVSVDSKNAAYVIYTSGSTGQPKGVQCSHRGVMNLLEDFQRRQPLKAGDRCSVWTSLSFDVSVYEIFSSLLFGGTLELVPEELRADGQKMTDWLNAQHIQSAYIPPFMLDTLCEWAARNPGKLRLKRLLVGVEPIKHNLLALLAELIPGLKVINGYGPTEASICATLYEVTAGNADGQPTPIGKPVANGQAYVLDKQHRPMPMGMTGELYLSGEGLARGYFNRPDLTAERFVPDPFSVVGGGRMYRTGDLVKWRTDGNLSFIGRADHQVKLRGYRIELGEIENVLQAHGKINQAVALLWKDDSSRDCLTGYVIRAAGVETLETSEVRNWLKERLPEYMVPGTIVEMKEFPLNPSGKIDRKRLPKPVIEVSKNYAGPRNPAEEILCAMWQDVLKVTRVGIHDNFFELGGHSLLATQMISRVPGAFGKCQRNQCLRWKGAQRRAYAGKSR
jgi:amino acid adenylation domain-containing protein